MKQVVFLFCEMLTWTSVRLYIFHDFQSIYYLLKSLTAHETHTGNVKSGISLVTHNNLTCLPQLENDSGLV